MKRILLVGCITLGAAQANPQHWYYGQWEGAICVPLEDVTIFGIVFHTPEELMAFYRRAGIKVTPNVVNMRGLGVSFRLENEAAVTVLFDDLTKCHQVAEFIFKENTR